MGEEKGWFEDCSREFSTVSPHLTPACGVGFGAPNFMDKNFVDIFMCAKVWGYFRVPEKLGKPRFLKTLFLPPQIFLYVP